MTINEREIVLDMLLQLHRGEGYSHQVLRDTLQRYQYLTKQSRSFVTRLFEGTLEYRYQIDWELDHYSKVPVRKMKPVIRELLRMGVYQILYMDQVPDSAVCNEAVKLAGKRGFATLKGFVNGILRTMAREKDHLLHPDAEKEPAAYLAWKFSMPEWIVTEWQQRFGTEQAERMLAAELAERPMMVRCNQRLTTRERLLDSLQSEDITVKPGHFLPQALELSGYDHLNRVTAFAQGWMAVQDESSMLAAVAADGQPGDRVLDVCAAPGGKSLFLAEMVGEEGSVTARDLTEYKVELIRENAERCGISNLTAECHDATIADPEWVGQADVVLADLPCSGLGIMGRKRDIKYRIRPEDRQELAALQRQILSVVREYVKPGGVLLYSTCTISRAENEDNVAWMQQEWGDFTLELVFRPEQLAGAADREAADRLLAEGQKGYIQLCPGVYPTDGFFLAKLRRRNDV